MADTNDIQTPEAVLDFWLTKVGTAGWYASDAALDEDIRARFAATWQAGKADALDHWALRPESALALLILLDQFPRNMYRGKDAAFSTDKRALCIAKKAINLGQDMQVAEPGRQFFYLPLMHSESLMDQHRCVRLILTRMPETGAENLRHALEHREVIRQFGRFPYRNGALGRTSTRAEERFLSARGNAA